MARYPMEQGYRTPEARAYGDVLGSLSRSGARQPNYGPGPPMPTPIPGWTPSTPIEAAGALAQLSRELSAVASAITDAPPWSNTAFSGTTNRNSDTRPIPAPNTTPTKPAGPGPGWSGDFGKNAAEAWAEAAPVVDAWAGAVSNWLATLATGAFSPFTAQALGGLAGFAGYRIGDALLPDADADPDKSRRRGREQEGVGKTNPAPHGRTPGTGYGGSQLFRPLGALAGSLMQMASKSTQHQPDLNRLHHWGRPADGGCPSTHATICSQVIDGASACLDGQAWPDSSCGHPTSGGAISLSLVQVYQHETLLDYRAHYAYTFTRTSGNEQPHPGIKPAREPAFAPAAPPEPAWEPGVSNPGFAEPAPEEDTDGAQGGRVSNSPHRLVPPGRGKREKKFNVSQAMGAVLKAATNAISEADDALDAIWKALPGEFRTRNSAGGPKGDRRNPSAPSGPTPKDKFNDLYRAMGPKGMSQRQWDAFGPQAAANLARELIEDAVAGTLGNKAGKALGKMTGKGTIGPAL